MQRIKIIKTGEIKLVENNEAHTLIEQGVAKLFVYKHRELKPETTIAFKPKRKKVYRKK